MSEHNTQQEIRLILSSHSPCTMFRNNTGQAWSGSKVLRLPGGKVVIQDARPVNFGLVKGGSDLIGWKSVTITPDMVGRQIAVFTAVEVKGPKTKITPEQTNFIDRVLSAGGLAGIARSPAEALEITNQL